MSRKKQGVKIVVVGDPSADKSQLLISFIQNGPQKESMTPVFDSCVVTANVDGRLIDVQLWDTSGQQEQKRIRPLSWAKADAVLIVFDVTNNTTFENACNKWYPEVQQEREEAVKVFVGNKIELLQDPSVKNSLSLVFRDRARKTVEEELVCKYMECSSKTHKGVGEVFDAAIRSALAKRQKPTVVPVKSSSCCTLI